jgi:hypothetical protein
MTVEQRLDQLEKRNKRLTVALTMTVVAMAAVVTMAATGQKRGDFDIVKARHIFVTNDAGLIVVALGVNDGGDGLVSTYSAKNKGLVELSSTVGGDYGTVETYQPNGKELVRLFASDNGGMVSVFNKTGEGIAQMKADEYGNGVVYAGNRKGMGRELKPGP